MRTRLTADQVIKGGCPDGFWARANCERAAQLGLCAMVTMVDSRPAWLRSAGADRTPNGGEDKEG